MLELNQALFILPCKRVSIYFLETSLHEIFVHNFTTSGYFPDEIGLEERLKFLNAICAALKTTNIPNEYWKYAAKDVDHKHTLVVHSRTGKITLVEWSGQTAVPKRVFRFGRIGSV